MSVVNDETDEMTGSFTNLLNLCYGALHCVTSINQYKLFFGSRTRLTIEPSKYWYESHL